MHGTRVVLLILCLSAVTVRVAAQEATSSTAEADKASIEDAIQAYIAAFHARDAKAMAEYWSSKGVYINKLSGEQVVGRKAIAAVLAAMFATQEKRHLSVSTESIEFISPNVALERGIATVTHPDQPAISTAYRGIYVRRDGRWLIDRMTEDEQPDVESHYEQLKDLEWLIGDWVDQAGTDTIKTECNWTKNKNYISRTFTVNIGDQVNSSGLQIIGWDPKQKQIRSWLFDSNGGFVEGTWTHKGDRWYVQSVATLADGGSGSFTSIHRPLDENSFSWQKIHRVVDGEILPNIDEVIITRK